MSQFKFNAPITGNNHYFGDVYNSSTEFLNGNPFLNFTNTERELVKIIFENTSSEEERMQILNDLRCIKEEPESNENKDNYIQFLNSFFEKVKKIGSEVTSKFIAGYLVELMNTKQ